MKFFNHENTGVVVSGQANEKQDSPLDLLEQQLSQPVINVSEVKKIILEYRSSIKDNDKKGLERILQQLKNKLSQIALNLPSRFNQNNTHDNQEDPKITLKKISDLIFYCNTIFKPSDTAIELLNHVKKLLEVNTKIVVCSELRKGFFEDLSKFRAFYPDETPEGLRDIYKLMKIANDEAIAEANSLMR